MKKNGMLVALMEEYERAIMDYKLILKSISEEDFTIIRNSVAEDPDCKSLQTVTFHVIQSGYTYANYIQSVSTKDWLEYNTEVITTNKAIQEIEGMIAYTKKSFHNNWYKATKELEEYSFKTRWNVTYDLEQLLEHAIVHILRHRRQIENFLKKN
ncbi:DinB family protein [Tenacibaculum halocynthiae]|uniref:DinB family protein n=1 Tax=Tenacibaculum halocynthiae TaxID=1254437 RepID=UPI003D6486AC